MARVLAASFTTIVLNAAVGVDAYAAHDQVMEAPVNSDEGASLLQLQNQRNPVQGSVDTFEIEAFKDDLGAPPIKTPTSAEKAAAAKDPVEQKCGKQRDCGSCVGLEDKSCRWCPKTRFCYKFGSLIDPCGAPINSVGQCWSDTCPHQLGEFLSKRPDDLLLWAKWMVGTMTLPIQRFPCLKHGNTGLYDMASGDMLKEPGSAGPAENTRFAHTSDWGSGTCEAKLVAKFMQESDPHHTAHLGDVYYVGTRGQFRTNVMGTKPSFHQDGVTFPKGGISTFLMNANHEMISGGAGLMTMGFRHSGQDVTYRAYMSDYWRFLHLDTGYECYKQWGPNKARRVVLPSGETDAPQPQEVIDWLVNTVKLGDPTDKRGIVIFTHHQPVSNWEKAYLGTAKQLSKILPDDTEVIWFGGHEHRLAFYERMRLSDGNWTANFDIFFRLVGNGGFPNTPNRPERKSGLVAFDERVYQTIPDDFSLGTAQSEPVGFNGYYTLKVNGPELKAEYLTLGPCPSEDCSTGPDPDSPTLVASETFNQDGAVGPNYKYAQSYTLLSDSLTCICGHSEDFKGCNQCSDKSGKGPETSKVARVGMPLEKSTPEEQYGTLKYTSMD